KSRPARFAAHGRTNENPAQGMGIRAPTERGSEIPQGTLGWGRLRGYAVHRHAASKGCLLTFRQALAMQRVRLGRCIDVATRARSAHKTAFDTNSGPLSLRRKAGAPRWLTSRPRTSITRGERMRPSTSMARPSLVNSSVTVRHLSCWPLAQ